MDRHTDANSLERWGRGGTCPEDADLDHEHWVKRLGTWDSQTGLQGHQTHPHWGGGGVDHSQS